MTGDRRPLFARDFPRVAQLDALVEAFARGDFARVRLEGGRLIASATDAEVRRAAQTLVERTNPDPLAIWLLVLAGGLLVALSGYWVVHGSTARSDHPASPAIPAPAAR